MIIKKQPIISWLLEDTFKDRAKIALPNLKNRDNYNYLSSGLNHLVNITKQKINWGLPVMLAKSFTDLMSKSAKSFFNMDHELFQEFGQDNECGILLSDDSVSIVYAFGIEYLYVWVFKTDKTEISYLVHYFWVKSLPNNHRQIYTCPTLEEDLSNHANKIEKSSIAENITNKLIIYLAVKKFAPIETVIIPPNSITKFDEISFPDLKKEKARNDNGQKVIVMDSKWYRKIVNDNDILVSGFFRRQRKKNAKGEWFRELIFVSPYLRHGYHRNAKIGDNSDL